MKQPGIVTFNLKDRGRKFTGQDRNFNIHALMDSINGPACQEKIKTRGMLGYFGHKARLLFGMEPLESGVVGGKYNEVEPALVTTYLEAFPDGTIKHQSEFLDNESGRKAERMYRSRVGGFSGVIDQGKHKFFGFDWVYEPNYSENRPYALDSVNLTFDQVLSEVKSEEEEFFNALINSKDAQIDRITAALDSAQTENEELLSLLSQSGIDNSFKPSLLPISVSLDSVSRMERDKSAFRAVAKLPGFTEQVSCHEKQSTDQYNATLALMGLKNV